MKNLQDGKRVELSSYSKSMSAKRGGKKPSGPKSIGYSQTSGEDSLQDAKKKSAIQEAQRIVRERLFYRPMILNRQRGMTGRPICPVCHGVIAEAFDVHEVFLTRKDVQGCDIEIRLQAHGLLNCVAIHPVGCHLKAQHEQESKDVCARFILEKEGDQVKEWIESLSSEMKSRTPQQAILWIDRLNTHTK